MPRGRKVSPEQIVVRLRQIEVQLAQGMSLALACKDAGLAEQTRDRSLARPRQSGAAAFMLGLPTARPRDSRQHPSPPVQGRCHALASQSARSKIPVRSASCRGHRGLECGSGTSASMRQDRPRSGPNGGRRAGPA